MKDLRLNALRALAAVYAEGGVRAAGEELGVSHSSVSRHIKELEAWTGLPLIKGRSGRRGVDFTEQGEVLAKAAAESLRDIQNAINSVKESRSGNAVIISTTASVAVRWLIPRLSSFENKYPSIQISVLTERDVSNPQNQGADLAIRMGQGPWDDVDCQILMNDELFPVIHPELLFQVSGKTRKDIFAHCPLIHDRDPAGSWNIWFEMYPNGAVDLRKGSRYSSSDLVLRAASQRLGIALARGRLVAEDIRSKTLARPFGDAAVEIKNAYWIVRPKNVRQRRAVDIVVEWLKSEA